VFEIRANDTSATLEVAKMVGMSVSPADVSFSRWRDNELLAGVIYRRYTHTSIEMHVASFDPQWLCRDFLWVCFHYPFEQLKVERVFAFVNEKNDDALHFVLRLGFQVETRIRKVYPDSDQIVLVMERDRCRWLKLRPQYMRTN